MADHDMSQPISTTGSAVRRTLSRSLSAADGPLKADGANQPKAMRAFSSALSTSIFDSKMGLEQTLITAFLYFKKPLSLHDVQQTMKDRLCEIPRFRSVPVNLAKAGERPVMAFQKLSEESLNQLMSTLVQDKTGILRSSADIDKFCSEVYGSKPRADLPLWRGYVCNNMDDGRSMFMLVIDHAIADGTALIQTLMSVLDDQPELPVPTKSIKPPPVSCFTQLRGLFQACWGPFIGDQLPGDPLNRLKSPDARNPGKSKAVCSTPDIDMARMREIKEKLPGATINDVLMTVVSLTLQEYFKKYEPATLHQKVRANFPINLRSATGSEITTEENFGNRFSQGQVSFPLHLEDPLAIYADVKSQLDLIKASPEPLVRDKMVSFVIMKSGLPLQTLANVLLDAYGKVTAMLSNVPGPLTKVNFMGQELDDLSFYAFAPVGLYFGIVQYAGQFKAGICVDASLEPKPQKLADCWIPAFERLYDATVKQPCLR